MNEDLLYLLIWLILYYCRLIYPVYSSIQSYQKKYRLRISHGEVMERLAKFWVINFLSMIMDYYIRFFEPNNWKYDAILMGWHFLLIIGNYAFALHMYSLLATVLRYFEDSLDKVVEPIGHTRRQITEFLKEKIRGALTFRSITYVWELLRKLTG